MELLRSLSFAGLLAVAGVVALAAGLSDDFSVGSLSVRVTGTWQRGGMIALGLGLLVVSGVLSLMTSRDRIPGAPTGGSSAQQLPGTVPPAASFLFSLDDSADPSFAEVVRGSQRLSILARTAVNVVAGYSHVLRDLVAAGCEIRIALLDPACPAADYVYGNKSSLYQRNLAQVMDHLSRLSTEIDRSHPGRHPQVRLIHELPPFSMLIAEKQQPDRSLVRIQLNLLYTMVGRDRPLFQLGRGDPWFDGFLREFDAIWHEHARATTIDDLRKSLV